MNTIKPPIIIILIIVGLLGVVLIINYSKEIPTENNKYCEGDNCEIKELDNGHQEEESEEYDDEHDHFVEIEGSEMKNLTVQEVADLWEIDAEILLSKIIAEFELKGNYTVDTVLEEIRDAEYKFSPAIIKDLAEEIKNPSIN